MFRLLAITAIISFVSAHCSDNIFFEKNKITEYTKISSRSSRLRSKSLFPALDLIEDLEKNGFGYHNYQKGSHYVNGVFMLYAYKSELGILIYQICDNVPEKVTGPLARNVDDLMGYHFKVKDFHRLNKHLADYNFKVYGQDEKALRAEIRQDRNARNLERMRTNALLQKEKWNDKSFISKLVSYIWLPLIIMLAVNA